MMEKTWRRTQREAASVLGVLKRSTEKVSDGFNGGRELWNLDNLPHGSILFYIA